MMKIFISFLAFILFDSFTHAQDSKIYHQKLAESQKT